MSSKNSLSLLFMAPAIAWAPSADAVCTDIACYAMEWPVPGDPNGVDVDAAGDVWVSFASLGKIVEYSAVGDSLSTIAEIVPGFHPHCVAFGDTAAFIADYNNARVVKITLAGEFIMSWPLPGAQRATYIALDASENVYVTDVLGNTIYRYTNEGALIQSWGVEPSPTGIAYDSQGDRLYIANSVVGKVEIYSLQGTLLGLFGEDLVYPEQISVDAWGRLWVADFELDEVHVYSGRDGTLLGVVGESGSGSGEFQQPHGLGTNESGDVFIGEWGNGRVQSFVFGSTSAAGRARPEAALMMTVSPNPTRHHFELSLRSSAGGRGGVAIYDAAGRKVAPIFTGAISAGRTVLPWNVGDQPSLAAGVYFVRAEIEGAVRSQRIVLIR